MYERYASQLSSTMKVLESQKANVTSLITLSNNLSIRSASETTPTRKKIVDITGFESDSEDDGQGSSQDSSKTVGETGSQDGMGDGKLATPVDDTMAGAADAALPINDPMVIDPLDTQVELRHTNRRRWMAAEA
ncbi:MAG: hypothetical protein Q9221_001436 [Calogaya cf. arnoldii]